MIRVQGESRALAHTSNPISTSETMRRVPLQHAATASLIETGCGGGLRVSELVALTCAHVIQRPAGKVQPRAASGARS